MQDDLMRRLIAQADAQNAASAPKKSSGFNLLDVLLPTIGGIAGGIGGTFVAPVAGTAAGGALGSGAGRWLSNTIQGREDQSEGVLMDATFGLLPGVGKLAKGAKGAVTGTKAGTSQKGTLSRFGNNLEEKGYDALTSNISLKSKAAEQLRPRDTLKELNKQFGVRNADEAADVGKVITGQDGLGTEAMRNAAYSAKGVDVTDITKGMDDQLMKDGVFVNNTTRKNLMNERQNVVDQVFGGKGSLTNKAAPAEAYDLAQDYGKRAFDLGLKDDVAANQLGKVYKTGERTIKDRIFNDPAAIAELPAIKANYVKLLKQEAAKRGGNQKKVLERFADKVDGITSPQELSTTMSPWVKANQIQEQMQVARNTIGGRNLFESQGSTLPGMVRNAVSRNPTVGNMMIKTGRALQGGAKAAGGTANPLTKRELIKTAAAQGVPRAVLAPALQGQSADALNEELPPEVLGAMTGEGMMPMDDAQAQAAMQGLSMNPDGTMQAANTPGGVDKNKLDSAIVQAAMSGDSEGMKQLMSLSDYLFPGGEAGALNSAGQKGMISMDAAENTVNSLEQILASTGAQDSGLLANIVGGVQGFAGGAGANDQARLYQSQAGSAATQLARAISGEVGAMSEGDIQRAKDMIPKLTDSAQVRAEKFNRIRQAIATNRNSTMTYGGGGDDLSSLASVMGGAY